MSFFFPPHLGGGEIRPYEVDLRRQSPTTSLDGTQVVRATPRTKGQTYDYIFLEPGQRESFDLSIRLGTPGRYSLTPILRYVLREKQGQAEGKPYEVVYPGLYRNWYLDSSPTSCQGEVCTGGDSLLMTHNILPDTQSDLVQLPPPTNSPSGPCLFEPSWIAFESSMVNYGYYNRLFLIDTDGKNFKALDAHDQEVRFPRLLGWLTDGQLLASRQIWIHDFLTQESREDTEFRLLDPLGGKPTTIISDTTLTPPSYADELKEACLSDGRGCFVIQGDQDMNRDGETDSRDGRRIHFVQDEQASALTPVTQEDQGYPALSSDERNIAFVQGIGVGDEFSDGNQAIYVARIDGSDIRAITKAPGQYRNPIWSPDGRFLSFVAARPEDNEGKQPCSETTIYHVFAIDLVTGIEYRLTSGRFSDAQPSWSPDSNWVLAGGDRLTLSRRDGSCTENVSIPPSGGVSNAHTCCSKASGTLG